MKIRTKLLTAVLATATALSCALTATAASTPKITLQGNESKPADGTESTTVELSLKATEFEDVAGADLEITLDSNVTLNDIEVVAAEGTVWTPLKTGSDINYAVKGNKLKIVDVFNLGSSSVPSLDLTVKLSFAGADIGRYDFTKTIRLIDKDENDITPNVSFGKLVVGKKTEKLNFDTTKNYDDKTKFLPYGILKNGDDYVQKAEDGSFEVTGDQEVTRFIKPENNDVTTFGASKIVETNAIQFGSYVDSIDSEAKEFGTLVIATFDGNGSFDDVVNYYKTGYSSPYSTTDEVLAHLVRLLKNSEKDDGKFHKLQYNSNSKSVYLSVVYQRNYMWKNENNTKLQYAVRYTSLKDEYKNYDYTAVGYYRVGDDAKDISKYNFSTEIKTAKYQELG